MSSGPFTRTFYEGNNGDIYRVRVQPETLAATIGGTANSAPAGPATVPISAKVSKGRNEIGIGCRKIRAFFETPPTGYVSQTIEIPILQPDLFDGLNGGEAVSYLSATGEVIGFTAESRR